MERKEAIVRREDRERSEEFGRRVFETCEYATMSMVDEKNEPYAVPISPVLVGDCLYIHGAFEGTKNEILKAHPRVCVSAVSFTHLVPEKFTTEYASAVAMGRVSVVEGEEEKRSAMREICLKYAESRMEFFDKAFRGSFHRTNVLKIALETITAKGKLYDRGEEIWEMPWRH